MGLSERFKEKLETNDLFTKKVTSADISLDNKNIKFISKPIEIETKKLTTEKYTPIVNILSDNNELSKSNENEPTITDAIEEIETRIISKIRKIPYWEEYSIQRQENMIKAYVNKKLNNLPQISINTEKQKDLIQNILALANNR